MRHASAHRRGIANIFRKIKTLDDDPGILTKAVYICVIRDDMIVYKKYLGQDETYDSIRALQGRADLVAMDSWSEVGLNYEKYNNEDVTRCWDSIAKAADGLKTLDRVPSEGTWGILYES